MAGTIDVGTIKVGGIRELKEELNSIKDSLTNLDVDVSGMDKLNQQMSQLEKTTESLTKELKDVEEGSDAFKSINSEIQKATKQMNLLKEASGKIDIDAKFDDIYESALPLTGRLGELEDRMYALAAAGLQNTEGFKALQSEAVNIRQTITRVDESVDDLAGNRGISTLGEQFTGLSDSILSLDFNRAAQQSQGLTSSLNNLKLTELTSGFKNLGTTFISLGKALLTNPIFLLVAAITAIVTGIIALMNAMGILKPIMNAIGKVFGWIGDAIGLVVQAIKDFLDWIGLTDFAAEEAAENAKKRHAEEMAQSKERLAALESRGTEEQNTYQRAIDLAKAEGKETYALEKAKIQASINFQKEKRNELHLQNQSILAHLRELDMLGARSGDYTLYNEARKEGNKLIAENNKAWADAGESIKDSENQLKILEINQTKAQAETVKKSAEANKKFVEDRKAALEKIAEIEEKFAYDQLTDRKKEIYDIDKNYKEAFLLAKKYKQDTTTLLANYNAEIKAVNDKFDQEELDKQKEQADALALLQRELGYKQLTENEAARQQEIDSLNDWYAEKLLLYVDDAETTKQLQEQQLLDQQALADKYATEDAEKLKTYNDQINELKYELNQVGLTEDEIARQNEIADLEKWYAEKMELAKLDVALQEEIQVAHQKKKMELLKADRDAEVQLAIDKGNDVADATKTGLQTLSDLVTAFAGQSEKQQERAFKVNKAANIAMAVVDTLKGAVAAFTSQIVATDPTSVVRGAIAAAMVTAAGVANIKKIASTQFKGATASNAGGGFEGAGGGGGVQPATPQTNLFGQSNNMNTLQGAQSVEAPQVVKAVVVESDITSSQSRIKRMEENATL